MSATMNFDLPRAGHFLREYTLVGQDDSPIDLSTATITASARDVPGGTVLASAAVTKTDASAGKFELLWTGSDFDAYGSDSEVARPCYDVKVTDAGVAEIPFRGQINLLPEITP